MQLPCPNCGRMLEAPEPLPPSAQCPFCAVVFTPAEPDARGTLGPSAARDPRQIAAERIGAPAIALIVTGVFDLLGAVVDLIARLMLLSGAIAPPAAFPNLFDPDAIRLGLVMDVVSLVIGVVIIYGAVKMRRLESFGVAITTSIVCMLPCVTCCFCLGIPFGIWALVVLNQEAVRAAFR